MAVGTIGGGEEAEAAEAEGEEEEELPHAPRAGASRCLREGPPTDAAAAAMAAAPWKGSPSGRGMVMVWS